MSVLSKYVERQVKKKGLIPFILAVGDLAVKATASNVDNKAWYKVREILKEMEKEK